MKKPAFNPDDWNSAPVEKVPAALSPSVAPSSNLSSILAVVGDVEASGIDITPTYSEWLAIAFALVAELGEDGRAIFHRLSHFNPEYDYNETDRQYSKCLKDGSREITIASLFHIAKSHGIAIGHDSVCSPLPPLRGGQGEFSSRNQDEEVEENEESEETRRSIPSSVRLPKSNYTAPLTSSNPLSQA